MEANMAQEPDPTDSDEYDGVPEQDDESYDDTPGSEQENLPGTDE